MPLLGARPDQRFRRRANARRERRAARPLDCGAIRNDFLSRTRSYHGRHDQRMHLEQAAGDAVGGPQLRATVSRGVWHWPALRDRRPVGSEQLDETFLFDAAALAASKHQEGSAPGRREAGCRECQHRCGAGTTGRSGQDTGDLARPPGPEVGIGRAETADGPTVRKARRPDRRCRWERRCCLATAWSRQSALRLWPTAYSR